MKRRKFIKILGGSPSLLYFSSCATTKTAAYKRGKLLYSFIFSNDIHVTTQEQAGYFGESINNWDSFADLYDFVVVCGDLANDGTAEELFRVKDQLNHLKNPYYTIVGNHDVTKPGDDGKAGYHKIFGYDKENYFVIHKKTALVFLDLTDGMSADVEIKKYTLDWLTTTLKEIPKRMPIIVFSHFPLHPNIPMFKVKGTSNLFAILDKRNVIAYFSGHYHARWQGVRNNVSFIGNSCLSLKRDNHDRSPQEGYLLVNVYDSGVETKFYERGSQPGKDEVF